MPEASANDRRTGNGKPGAILKNDEASPGTRLISRAGKLLLHSASPSDACSIVSGILATDIEGGKPYLRISVSLDVSDQWP
jgi:hypothetical protein